MGPAPGLRCPAGNGKPPRGPVIYARASAPWRGRTQTERKSSFRRDKARLYDFPTKSSEERVNFIRCTGYGWIAGGLKYIFCSDLSADHQRLKYWFSCFGCEEVDEDCSCIVYCRDQRMSTYACSW